MPIAGCSARHLRGPSTLIARAPERPVQFRLHKILDEPPHPISDHRVDRIKPGRPQNLRRRARQVSAILHHGVISIGVSPPSLARFTSRRLHHSEFQPLSRRNLNRWLRGFALSIGLSAGSAHAAVTEDTFLLRNTGDLVELCSGAQSDPLYTAAVNFCQGFTVGVFRVLQEEDMAKLSQHMFCLPSPTPSRNETISGF